MNSYSNLKMTYRVRNAYYEIIRCCNYYIYINNKIKYCAGKKLVFLLKTLNVIGSKRQRCPIITYINIRRKFALFLRRLIMCSLRFSKQMVTISIEDKFFFFFE